MQNLLFLKQPNSLLCKNTNNNQLNNNMSLIIKEILQPNDNNTNIDANKMDILTNKMDILINLISDLTQQLKK